MALAQHVACPARWTLGFVLLLALAVFGCSSPPQAQPPVAALLPSAPACTGDYVKDLRRMEEGTDDEFLRCAASFAEVNPSYRAAVAYGLLLNRSGESLPGYQEFGQVTQLSFGEARTFPVPDGWVLRDAVPSPDGRYVAARLRDGSVGWWLLETGEHERYDVVGYDIVWHPTEAKFATPAGPRRMLSTSSAAGMRGPCWPSLIQMVCPKASPTCLPTKHGSASRQSEYWLQERVSPCRRG